jgi:uracil DNA glycosylase
VPPSLLNVHHSLLSPPASDIIFRFMPRLNQNIQSLSPLNMGKLRLTSHGPAAERCRSNLVAWTSSGVLLLNSSLTVQAGIPGSHSNKGWETFTEQVLKVVDKYGGANLPTMGSSEKPGFGRGVVFMAWGA